jgi:hypothetical protein
MNSLIIKNNCDVNDLLLSNYSSSVMLKKTILINQISKSTLIFSFINSMKQIIGKLELEEYFE